jgi:hypothetical protein
LNRNFGFSNLNFRSFEPKLRGFRTETSFSYPKLRVFENRSFVFLNQSSSFCKDFFSSESSEYQIHTKFRTKFRLSGNRRNSRSFGRKLITVYKIFTQQFKISGFRNRNIPEDNFYGSFEFKNFTRNFGVLNRNFEFSYRNFGFLNRNFRCF